MYVESNFFVGLRDIDINNNLNIKSMLSFLEDIGGIHSNKVGYGLLDIPIKKKSWILLNWKVQIISKPKYSETLRVKTWARAMDRIYAYRDFEIFNEKNELVIIATSKWVCIDTEKQSIIKVTGELKDAYTMEDRRVFENEIEKLIEPEAYSDSCEIDITRDLIDINGHVHNLNYMDFANRILPVESSKNVMNVEIMYKKQIKEGEKIKCFYSNVENTHYVVIKSEDEKNVHAIVKLS